MYVIADNYPDTEGKCYLAFSASRDSLENLLHNSIEEANDYGVEVDNLTIMEVNAYYITELEFNDGVKNIYNISSSDISLNSDFKINIGQKTLLFKIIDSNITSNQEFKSISINIGNKSFEYLVLVNDELSKYIRDKSVIKNIENNRVMFHHISGKLKENKFYPEGCLNE